MGRGEVDLATCQASTEGRIRCSCIRNQPERPGRFTPGKKPWHQLYMRSGGIQGQSEWVRKISPTLEFEIQTVRPAASCYTNTITRSPIRNDNDKKKRNIGGKTHSSTTLLITNLTSTRPASNPGLRIERPTTNARSYVVWNFRFYLTTNMCHIHDTEQPVNVVYCTAHTVWADVGVRKCQAHRQKARISLLPGPLITIL